MHLCGQVPKRAAHTHFKSTWQTCHSVRAGETDGVEAHSKSSRLWIKPNPTSETNTQEGFFLSCVFVMLSQTALSRVLEKLCVLYRREGSSGRGYSSWWRPTARIPWRNVPERPSASCLMCRQRLQSSAPWKVWGQPLPQVSTASVFCFSSTAVCNMLMKCLCDLCQVQSDTTYWYIYWCFHWIVLFV